MHILKKVKMYLIINMVLKSFARQYTHSLTMLEGIEPTKKDKQFHK